MVAVVHSYNSHTKPLHVLPKSSIAKYNDTAFRYFLTNHKTNNYILFLFSVLLALNGWLKNDSKSFVLFSGAAIIIFRAELALFLGLLLLYDLVYGRLTIKR